MENTTKQLLTTIAENQPKIKELGYNEGFSAGKKAEYDEFWDSFQDEGRREAYASAFFSWTRDNFNPKYIPIVAKTAGSMFMNAQTGFDNFKLEKSVVDFSQCTEMYRTFQQTYIAEIEELNLSSVTTLNDILRNARTHTIGKLIFNTEGKTPTVSLFDNATKLANIGACEGLIANSLKMSVCPLTPESIKNIITCLKDYSGTTSENTYTITFKSTAFAELEAEGNTSPNGNTWTEYIDDLKWNLTLA